MADHKPVRRPKVREPMAPRPSSWQQLSQQLLWTVSVLNSAASLIEHVRSLLGK